MLKEKTMCVGDLVSNREFDVNCNFDIYDCTKPGADWTDDAKRIFSTIENGWVEPPDDVLKMAIRYVTLDFSRYTIVVEAGRAS